MLPLAAVLLSCVASGQGAAPPAATLQPLDPAKISSMKSWQLRREMEKVESRFYALYNKLNERNEFDIVCVTQVQPNSKFKYRACRPRFQQNSENADASAFLDGVLFTGANTGSGGDRQSISTDSLQSSGSGSGQRGGNALLPQSEAAMRVDEYRKHMLATINASPDLLILVRDREALGTAFNKLPPDQR
jgi:hypothetical protein